MPNVSYKSDTYVVNRLLKNEDGGEDEGVIDTHVNNNDNKLGIDIVICNGCFSVMEKVFVF